MTDAVALDERLIALAADVLAAAGTRANASSRRSPAPAGWSRAR
nr:hypothetical protein [Methyloceanibacter superfactus]